jgi:hypothetical protein
MQKAAVKCVLYTQLCGKCWFMLWHLNGSFVRGDVGFINWIVILHPLLQPFLVRLLMNIRT